MHTPHNPKAIKRIRLTGTLLICAIIALWGFAIYEVNNLYTEIESLFPQESSDNLHLYDSYYIIPSYSLIIPSLLFATIALILLIFPKNIYQIFKKK